MAEPELFADADSMAAAIFARTGGAVRLALPLGLGKPLSIVNALTRMAAANPSLRLTIFTALTLSRPRPESDMERRFLEPALDRLFGAYPELHYAEMIREDAVPDNITVSEFFFQAGDWLSDEYAQRHYISASYTHARDVLIAQRPNVVAQLFAEENGRLSMACNTDISADLFAFRGDGRMDFIAVGEISDEMPFMDGPAALEMDALQMKLEPHAPYGLFSAVRRPVSDAQHAIGLHVARQIRDGGTLQIGIGAIGDAVANALLLRDAGRLEDVWRAAPMPLVGDETGRFEAGLYAVTEMLVGGLIALLDAGILRREVGGAVIHAGFFVEAREMYQRLRDMAPERRGRISMMPVSYTNALYGDEAAKRAARVDARFVNGAMQASLLGDVMSDSARPGQVVSGVGGQMDFVAQALALEGARAIVTLPATRCTGGRLTSNIVWTTPVVTIPRHMRDIVVTEYGAADLRGQTDEEVIKRMIAIADSRFQTTLAAEAQRAGKLDRDWRVPEAHRRNTPDRVRDWLAPWRGDALPDFPLGTDFDEIERALLPALARLREAALDRVQMARLMAASLWSKPHPQEGEALKRMGYDAAPRLFQPLSARALRGALRAQAAHRP
ncbi:acetyl-CoA hydrolase/transferase C-terminal domain-containing protein [Pelagivirga sediminicola]|uniref:acetyl-CoA hydrolase/transferase C-terminal domain-containing protein n=1 Tax=Pelagivirga sediminicola TaxID=2170575 RepID=UPI001FAF601E|nr:acetyl-CoA hydrolase/transferase C-terminal domain-containing protein [Pelagivirga sediminicola]